MTEKRKKLIDRFQSWLDTNPREQIIAAVCANIAEEYAEHQLGCVIWRCTQNIQDIYGKTIFTKGLVYEQIKIDEYPMMLIDNKVEESEVYNLKDYFTSI